MRLARIFQLSLGSTNVLILGATLTMFLLSGASAQTIKMTAGQSGINPGTSLPFIAQKENLFAKYGLDVKIIPSTSPSMVQAMLGGSMQISTTAPGAPFITATLEGAPPFVLVSSWVNVFTYTIISRKEITSPKDLKGKVGQVGASFGSLPDVALRFGLTKFGLDPEKDVKLIQMPRVDWANVIAQVEKGDVQFALLPPPYDRLGEKRGFRALISLPDLGIPWQTDGEWVQRSYLRSNREAVLRFVRAIADAMRVYYHQKEKTLTYLAEFMGTSDPQDTEYAYEMFAKWSDRVPTPKAESLRTIMEAIKKTTPKAASADPASFIDTSLVDQLLREGYFK